MPTSPHAYAVRAGALTVTVLATGGYAAIVQAMELHGQYFTSAWRVA